MSYQKLRVRKLTPRIGAELFGVDLAQPLDNETLREIRDALLENQVIFFRDQDITIDQQKDFGRGFGELHIHPAAPSPEGHPEILRIHGDANSKRVAGEGWHTDVSCDAEPPMGSILRLHTVPDSGGDTLFASMYAAYDALSQHMKDFLAGLTAIHSGEQVYRGRYEYDGGQRDDTRKSFPVNEHPVIRTHPETGRQSIYVNPSFTSHIPQLSRRESDAVLGYLYAHCARPEFQCRFRWEVGSIAFWDNRCAQHHALWDYFPKVRSGNRVTIKGDRPFYRAQTPERTEMAA